MIYREPYPLKKLGLWFLLISSGLFTGYIVFIAVVSIWVGFNESQKDGFWMPILFGTVSGALVLVVFFRFLRIILHRMKEKNIINI